MGYTITETISCADSSTLLADAKAHAAKIGASVTLQLGASSWGQTALNVSGTWTEVKKFTSTFSG